MGKKNKLSQVIICYGSRRIRKALNALSYPVGQRTTPNLIKEAKVFVRYRKKSRATTNSKHKNNFDIKRILP